MYTYCLILFCWAGCRTYNDSEFDIDRVSPFTEYSTWRSYYNLKRINRNIRTRPPYTEKGRDVIDYTHDWKGNQLDLNRNAKRDINNAGVTAKALTLTLTLNSVGPKLAKLLERRPWLSC